MEIEKEAQTAPKTEQKPKELEPTTKRRSVFAELKQDLVNLQKAIAISNSRETLRISKTIKKYRNHLLPNHIEKIWALFFPEELIEGLQQYANCRTEFTETLEITPKKALKLTATPEIVVFLRILRTILHFGQKDYLAAEIQIKILLNSCVQPTKHHFDYFSAQIYFYYSLLKEKQNKLISIREELFQAYRTSCLRHDEIGQATLLNLLLRNYLHYNQYEQVYHLISKCNFPETKSNNEFCRYLYYTGKIKAIRQDYQESLFKLNQAVRKAPDSTALTFKIEAQKLAIVVELLQGDIPNREIFVQQDMKKALFPYYKLVGSVLKGTLQEFNKILQQYESIFIRDKLYTLILRLHQMVIRTGLRKINTSYSRISFTDIAEKLNLPADNQVEFIVAKAIRDGVMNAVINHEAQIVTIQEQKDLYNTNLPQKALQKRISYFLNLYNQTIKALQYPNSKFTYAERNDEENEDILKKLEEESEGEFL